MLDFLIIGHKIEVIHANRPFSKVFGNAIRSVNVAIELSKLNFKVGLIVDHKESGVTCIKHKNVELIHQEYLEEYCNESKVLIFSTTKPEVLAGVHNTNPQKIKHKRKILLSCFVSTLPKDLARKAYEGFDLITVNNNEQHQLVKQVCNELNVQQLDFGATNLTRAVEPFKQPKGLWVGSIRHPEILVKIIKTCRAFEEVNFSIVTRLVFDSSRKVRGSEKPIKNAVVNLLDTDNFSGDITKVLSDWCGMSWPNNLSFLGGANDDYDAILCEHNFGLDFSRSVGQKHDNTKVIDYLSTGMYVLTENLAPSVRYVKEMDNGFVVQDFERIKDDLDIFHELSIRDRRVKRSDFINKYSWNKIVERLLTYLPEEYQL